MTDNFLQQYWRGRGELWKIYWLYGVLGSTALSAIIFLLFEAGAVGSLWFQLVLLFAAAYTVWIVVSVWRCAFNVEDKRYGHIARGLTVAWAINAVFILMFLEIEFLQAVA